MAIHYTRSDVPKAHPKADIAPKPKHPGGRPKSENAKLQITLRLDPEVIAKFKATGSGWQARINEELKRAAP